MHTHPRRSTFIGALATAADEAVRHGEISPGSTRIRMLIVMGAIGEAATGYVISGRPQLTPELADGLIDVIFDGWMVTSSRESKVESR